jgi:hypothetical protein
MVTAVPPPFPGSSGLRPVVCKPPERRHQGRRVEQRASIRVELPAHENARRKRGGESSWSDVDEDLPVSSIRTAHRRTLCAR